MLPKQTSRALVFALTMLSAGLAHADGDASATAEDLFQRAKSLVANGRWNEACPLLAESYRLDPAGGTLQNLAVCYESAGKWASAFARFEEMKTLAKKATPPRPDRVKFADEHLAKVTSKVSRLVVTADEAAVVEIEGVTYQRVAWTAGIALDPGPHDVLVTALGKKPFQTTVTIPNEKADQKLEVPALEDVPVETAIVDDRHTDEEKARAKAEAEEKERRRREEEQRLRARRTGYLIGGAGALALVGAGVTGFLTLKFNDDASVCKGPLSNDVDGHGRCFTDRPHYRNAVDARSTARTLAVVTDVLAGVGVAAVGVGLYFVLVRGSSHAKTATLELAPTLGGAMATGTF